VLDVLDHDARQQAAYWGSRRQRGWKDAWWEKAGQEAEQARQALGPRTCLEMLVDEGFQLEFSREPATMGALRMRARLNLRQRHLLVYEEALADVSAALTRLGHPSVSARDLVLAHEAFHVLRPRCPESFVELAAHRFAGELLGLPFFAGLVDFC
jgi:hypothetical protein